MPPIFWSGTEHASNPLSEAWVFQTDSGWQAPGYKGAPFWAMAVHPGDVGVPIPEPQTYALFLLGLAGLALKMRRQPR
jgi:hypothetical protein